MSYNDPTRGKKHLTLTNTRTHIHKHTRTFFYSSYGRDWNKRMKMFCRFFFLLLFPPSHKTARTTFQMCRTRNKKWAERFTAVYRKQRPLATKARLTLLKLVKEQSPWTLSGAWVRDFYCTTTHTAARNGWALMVLSSPSGNISTLATPVRR